MNSPKMQVGSAAGDLGFSKVFPGIMSILTLQEWFLGPRRDLGAYNILWFRACGENKEIFAQGHYA